jgi:hypothetical protein
MRNQLQPTESVHLTFTVKSVSKRISSSANWEKPEKGLKVLQKSLVFASFQMKDQTALALSDPSSTAPTAAVVQAMLSATLHHNDPNHCTLGYHNNELLINNTFPQFTLLSIFVKYIFDVFI